jgi:endoglucanase
MKRKILILTFILFVCFTACGKDQPTQSRKTPDKSKTLLALHADGRWLVNTQNDTVILRGVNIASLEWSNQGENILKSLQAAAKEWNVNLVRIPLSQDRWFGKASGQSDNGLAYRALVSELVQSATRLGVYVLLELHWSNAGVWGQYIGQHKMPDVNSKAFLQDLATTFANHPAVLIGLYNEPHDVSWDIWHDGGSISENYDVNGTTVVLEFQAEGFEGLYQTVRQAGASQNILVIGGLDWGYDLTGIANGYGIQGENIMYDSHCYPWKSTNWNGSFGNVGQDYPIIVGEWGGETTTEHLSYGRNLADYLRSNKFNWTAWCFHPSAGPTLIKNWNYEPTPFGELVLNELKKKP